MCFRQILLISILASGYICDLQLIYVKTKIRRDFLWILTSELWALWRIFHYDDVIMSTIASRITSLTVVYPTIYSGADQSKYQSSASLAFVWGIHRGPVNSPHKWPVTRKMFPFDDVIMDTHMCHWRYKSCFWRRIYETLEDDLSMYCNVICIIGEWHQNELPW